jgi:hypothetical protein
MNDGIKILLERLKTHPEEFTDDENPFSYEGKWMRIFEKYKHNLSKEDVGIFLEAFNNLRQEKFTAEVMAELLDPKEEEQLTLSVPPRKSGTVSATPIPAISSITLEQNEQLRAQVNAMKVEVRKKPVLKKQHQTLFGKLFNYS